MMKRRLVWGLLLAVALAIKIFSLFPSAVERYYSNGWYPRSAALQRMLFGWLPFSVGDLLYLFLIGWIGFHLFRIIRRMRQRRANRGYWVFVGKRLAGSLLILYISFNLLWGLNYNRLGVSEQLQLSGQSVSSADLQPLMQQLVYRVNEYYIASVSQRDSLRRHRYLFAGAGAAYQLAADSLPFMTYRHQSVKASLFGFVGNYLGYTGYYNPFTGEAQVNTAVPDFVLPFTTCHEIGHQLGYAKESEANFAGFLSARRSADPLFLYSVYFDLYSYGRPYLYRMDSVQLIALDRQLQPGVRRDFKGLKDFYQAHANPLEETIDRLYGQYLRANEQPSGKVSYSEVMIWLIAYFKKYGSTAL